MNCTACISKSCDNHLSDRLYGLRLLRSWFTRWSPLFWLFLRLGCEIMDPCFVHSNESMQKFIWIMLKHLQTLKSSHNRAYSPQWANAAPILPIAFSYPIVRAKLKLLCHVICLWLQQLAYFHSSVKIVDFIDDFWRSLNWTSRMRCITCGRPRLNSFIQLYTVANAGADVLWTLSNSALISFSIKPFICRCLISAWNSFFFILQKIQRFFALIYRNEITRWIPLWQ